MDERQLIERARQGDVAAYESLVRRYQSQALRAAYLVLGQQQEAEDAVQEAFVRAWHALDGFKSDRSFRPWLLTIVTNQARDRGRATSRRRKLTIRQRNASADPRFEPSPESALITQEQIDVVLDELERLPEMDRIVLSYRFLLDLPTAEIAEILGIAHGTVRSRISRALTKLRNQLSDDDEWKQSANGE